MKINIDVDELVIDTFRGCYKKAVNCEIDELILKGGRSSTKSQVAAYILLNGVMMYNQSAVATVKYANSIQNRLVNTFTDAIDKMGIGDFWKLRKTPLEYVLLDSRGKETDVSIKFTGCEDASKLKSFHPRKGSFRYLWIEELENFSGIEEIYSLEQTFLRGEGGHCCIMTYNPPIRTSNWVNKAFDTDVNSIENKANNWIEFEVPFEVNDEKYTKRRIVHHSTYLDVIDGCTVKRDGKTEKLSRLNWLGLTFVGGAEEKKLNNFKYYQWAYLGLVVGTDANVFTNIVDWDGDKSKLDNRTTQTVYRGLDFGYGGPEPTAYVEWCYDPMRKRLYAMNEFGKPEMSEEETAVRIKELNIHNHPVVSDSAVPKLNAKLKQLDINIVPIKKYKDSKLLVIRWFQKLNGIYIDKTLTPNLYKEFKEYEYKINKSGEVTASIQEDNDHYIDASRYALQEAAVDY